MWLFHYDDSGALHFDQFTSDIPEYAILSHRWRDPGEVLFSDTKDLDDLPEIKSPGVRKIHAVGRQALEDGIRAFWIDTCCINKDSSAELQEAINSMFKWYEGAAKCYAYLDDVWKIGWNQEEGEMPQKEWFTREDGKPSEWFERAWTLQELIAPNEVLFLDRNWSCIGTRTELSEVLAGITGIDESLLSDKFVEPQQFSIAQRMSWAAKRKASRLEDIAYSLLGIFNVNMPMLYGEGHKAFRRLQHEIIRTSTDQSILAWDPFGQSGRLGVFAPSPEKFVDCGDIVPWNTATPMSFYLSNGGLNIDLPIVRVQSQSWPRFSDFIDGILLHCRSRREPGQLFVLCGQINHHGNPPVFELSSHARLQRIRREHVTQSFGNSSIILRGFDESQSSRELISLLEFQINSEALQLHSFHPPTAWNHQPDPNQKLLHLDGQKLAIMQRSNARLRLTVNGAAILICFIHENGWGELNVGLEISHPFQPMEGKYAPPPISYAFHRSSSHSVVGFGFKATIRKIDRNLFGIQDYVYEITAEPYQTTQRAVKRFTAS